jgi:hypothetical protein
MKLARLFKKIENFFSMDEQERTQKRKNIEKLSLTLAEKIESKKEKLQSLSGDRKKDKIKKELEILKKFEEKLKKEQEEQTEDQTEEDKDG